MTLVGSEQPNYQHVQNSCGYPLLLGACCPAASNVDPVFIKQNRSP